MDARAAQHYGRIVCEEAELADGCHTVSRPASGWTSLPNLGASRRALLPVAQPRSRRGSGRGSALGGLRRRGEKTVSGAFDLAGLDAVQSIRRLVEIAAIDSLGLENSIARSRTLISAALAAAKLFEVGELETRIAQLEAAVGVGREPISDDLFEEVA